MPTSDPTPRGQTRRAGPEALRSVPATKEIAVSKSVLYMSMSLDGFITGPHDGPGNGLGTGGHRLHEWLGAPVSERPYFDPPGLSGQVFAEAMATTCPTPV